jgi:hypothetical protein
MEGKKFPKDSPLHGTMEIPADGKNRIYNGLGLCRKMQAERPINSMKTLKLGKSIQGRDILGYLFAKKKNLPTFLILATVHGDEIEGWWLADYFKNFWNKNFPYTNI